MEKLSLPQLGLNWALAVIGFVIGFATGVLKLPLFLLIEGFKESVKMIENFGHVKAPAPMPEPAPVTVEWTEEDDAETWKAPVVDNDGKLIGEVAMSPFVYKLNNLEPGQPIPEYVVHAIIEGMMGNPALPDVKVHMTTKNRALTK